MATRLYIASDLHAAEKAWRKFLNAITLNVYKADVALLAGDLTGKAIVPIVQRDGALRDRAVRRSPLGTRRRGAGAARARHRRRRLLLVHHHGRGGRAARRRRAEPRRAAARSDERARRGVDGARHRAAADGSAPLYLIPGNDDDFGIDPILDRPGYRASQRRRQGARHPRRPPAARLGLVEPHAVADAARGDRGRALRAPGALAEQVRDPRKAVFMIHVPPHDSGLDTAPLLDENLRPTVSAGDVLRGPVGSTAVRRSDRDVPAAARRPRPHPRVRRRAQDRPDALHQPRQRGQPRHPARLPRRHRAQGRSSSSSASRASRARRALSRTPQKRIAATASALGAADQPIDRNVLVDHVRDADARRYRTRAARSRSTESPRACVSVAPSYHESSPPSRPARPMSAVAPSMRLDDRGSDTGISNGITALGHHSIAGGCSASQSSRAVSRTIHSSTSRRTSAPQPRASACAGHVHHRDRQVARGRIGHRPFAAARDRRQERGAATGTDDRDLRARPTPRAATRSPRGRPRPSRSR